MLRNSSDGRELVYKRLTDPSHGLLLPEKLGFEDGKMFDRYGRPRQMNLRTVSEYLKTDILAIDRLMLPESNIKEPLFPFQRVIIRTAAEVQFLFLQMMRGGSKTYTMARFALDYALQNADVPIVFTGPSFRQSLLLYDEVLKMISKNERYENTSIRIADEIKGDPKRNATESILHFHNGSSIRALPMGDGCLVPNSQVLLADKFGTISGCFTPSFDKKATAVCSETIWTQQGWRESDQAYSNGIANTYKITTKRGYVIEGTANHGLKNSKNEWVRLDECQIGTKLPLDRSLRWHNSSIDATVDECYAAGLLIGDGCLTNKYKIGFATKDFELAEALKVILPELSPASDGVHWNAFGIETHGNLQAKFQFVGHMARDKQFPIALLQADKAQTAAFISGLFDTDGSVEKKTQRVSFTNTSETLVRQLQFMLLHFGIVCSVRERDRAASKWEPAFELMISGKATKLFAERIGFRLLRKRNLLLKMITDKQRWVEHGKHTEDVYIDTVKSIEQGKAPTFDCHVPDGNEYIANGFVSHNSKIRGIRGGMLVLDEFYQMSEEQYESHITPFLTVKQGGRASKLIHCTTSWYQDCFAYRRLMQIASMQKSGDKSYAVLDFNLNNLVECGFPLDKNITKDAQRHQDPTTFLMTYFNIWPSSSSRWFEQKYIDHALSKQHEVKIELKRPEGSRDRYFGVIDLAASDKGDSTEITVHRLVGDKLHTVYAYKQKGLQNSARALLAHRISNKFGLEFLEYDAHAAIGIDFKNAMAEKELLVDGILHKVRPMVHHDNFGVAHADRKLIPIAVKDTIIADVLVGPRGGEIRGEAGLRELLFTKTRELLNLGMFLAPAEFDEDSMEESDASDTIREAYQQLGNIGIKRDKNGEIAYSVDGRLLFTTRPGVHDDGAMCLVYSVVGYLRMMGRTNQRRSNDVLMRAMGEDQSAIPETLVGPNFKHQRLTI